MGPQRRPSGKFRNHPKRDTRDLEIQVGRRVRIGRMLRGMTQMQLGDALGLTFQQIQKYESGANRVGAGRLFLMAGLFEVPVDFFFVDVTDGTRPGAAPRALGRRDRLALDVMRQLARIDRADQRKAVQNIAHMLADAGDGAAAVAAE